MHFYILESGSKGNSTLIINDGHVIVIDNGLSKKKFLSKIKELGYSLLDIEAVLITHSHGDHIDGINVFSKDKLYAAPKSIPSVNVNNELVPFEKYQIAGFTITSLPTSHDVTGSCGFLIEDKDYKLVYMTDTGYIYERVLEYITNADFYIFESNHNVRMLINTNRPQHLKNRIMGDVGHLSNEDSANYICDIIGNKTKQIVLAHLSEEANSPYVAIEDYKRVFENRGVDFNKYEIYCASQTNTVVGGNK